MSSQYIDANILDVPYLKEMLLGLRIEENLLKNSFANSGILTIDNTMRELAMRSTGTIEIDSWEYKKTKAQDYLATTDTVVHNIPTVKQRAVIMGIVNAWGAKILANYISQGATPDEAINMMIEEDIPVALNDRILASINGALSATSLKDLNYSIDAPMTHDDYVKALQQFAGDRNKGVKPILIMNSEIQATLKLELKSKFDVDFLQGVRIVEDDEGTDNGDGTFNTYVVQEGAIKWSGFLPLGSDNRFVYTDELKNQGQRAAGYRERWSLAINGVSFKGTLANPVGATEEELKLGTNWELVNDKRKVGIGVIKSQSYKKGAGALSAKKVETSPKG